MLTRGEDNNILRVGVLCMEGGGGLLKLYKKVSQPYGDDCVFE